MISLQRGCILRWKPFQDITIENGEYRCTGDNPELLLEPIEGSLPVGWVQISIKIRSDEELEPTLWLRSEDKVIGPPAPIFQREDIVLGLVFLPARHLSLRLRFKNSPSAFTVQAIRINSIGAVNLFLKTLLFHLKPIAKNPFRLIDLVDKSTKAWQINGFNGVLTKFFQRLSRVHDYNQWLDEFNHLTRSDRSAIGKHIAEFKERPLFTLFMPINKYEPENLSRAIDSVRTQLYPHWQLLITASRPTHDNLAAIFKTNDARIKVLQCDDENFYTNANLAVKSAKGNYFAFIGQQDELTELALYLAAAELNKHPQADIIYSDEDCIDSKGMLSQPKFKPDWNPDLFTAYNYLGRLCLYRTALIQTLGGLRADYQGSEEWDLSLRIIERVPKAIICHMPFILYHRRADIADDISETSESARKALADHFIRRGLDVAITSAAGGFRVKYPLPTPPPLITLIIPTRNRYDLLHRCVESIYKKSSYSNFEIIIIDNQSDDLRTLAFLDELALRGVRVLRYDDTFNYSAINNYAVGFANGEIIGLINNDIEVITTDWMEEMASHAFRPDVGAVGAMLYYPNETIQHAGVVISDVNVDHAYKHWPREQISQAQRAAYTQNYLAVTAACLFMRKKIFEDANRLNETDLQISFNDVDLCLRLGERGYRIVWTPHAELYHHESASRGKAPSEQEKARINAEFQYLMRRWRHLLSHDPFYNPNLTLNHFDFSLASSPRVTKPWRQRNG